MICSNCGYVNKKESLICEKCKKTLNSRNMLPPYQSNNYDKIENSVKQLKNFKISLEDFKKLISKFKKTFTQSLNEVISYQNENYDKSTKKEIKVGIKGIKTFIEALDILMSYSYNKDSKILDNGLIKAKLANNMVNEALIINWKNYRQFQKDTEDFILANTNI